MTYPTPTEPGVYWAKFLIRDDFEPVQTDSHSSGLVAFIIGHDGMFVLSDFTWGPRITMPEGLGEGE